MENSSRGKPDPTYTELSQFDRADRICDAYERGLLHGQQPSLEDFLVQVPDTERGKLKRELEAIKGDYERRSQELRDTTSLQDTNQLGSSASRGELEHPARIARFRIERLLGQGGFGSVYLAHDEQLGRRVAVKVPHATLISNPDFAGMYLAEARTVANLDHANIVAVHDVGSTEDFPCYVVSKYIEGMDLSKKLKQHRLNYEESCELVATVADALHYAHKQGLVHRDIKPGNILIGTDGKPYVVDFGLALREDNIGQGPKYAGTPAYMSPEQARGEGHRVDGRSDIFSLGVVFYQLLVGRRPFRGDTQAELLVQVARYEPRPVRQYDDTIPKELERICHKAIAKRASERYSTAKDLSDELRLFLSEQATSLSGTSPGGIASAAYTSPGPASTLASRDSSAASSGGDGHPIMIVPKGLRSFDAHDADFFLKLLPGPRDREGLPESLRFWKTRIEETDCDNTFSVGLIYGPSGCGKSSLVRAGLLPRLSEQVIPVYIEATPDETETRLLQRLRKQCPALGENLNLKEALTALRQGQGIPVGKKILIVLDQFEQWLHAKKEHEDTGLVQALRQCDGGRVQCIVMVRDDFWMAATKFMGELEVELLQGQNTALVDLFDLAHARKVLSAFGRAFGKLPDQISDTTRKEKDFLKQSVAGLAEEGKVICVRLALFAEMMKGKDWTPATLKEVGGTQGIGVTFLEETFSAQTAHPKHRLHQKAARAVLKDLLPDSGTDIKGYMRSRAELLEASGYAGRPKEFDDLMRILDSEIRLITPTDPEGKDADDDSVSQTQVRQTYFQLTHDYLVQSLRDWLTRKQKETRKGRTELMLLDTSVTWNAKPENRFLPSWLENLNIWMYTDNKQWTASQRKMMGKARRVHGLRTTAAALLLVAASLIGISIRNSVIESNNITRAEALVGSLLKADIAQVPAVISELTTYRAWADPLLTTQAAAADNGSSEKLHLSLALLPLNEGQIDYLSNQLPVCTLSQFAVLRGALLPHKDKLTEPLWKVAQNEERDHSSRFQAAAALAQYAPNDERWQQTAPLVARQLTSGVSSVLVDNWRQLFKPASKQLAAPLTAIHADRTRGEKQRETAAFVLSDYLRDQPKQLTDVILVADEVAEFSLLIAALRPQGAAVHQRLLDEMRATMPDPLSKSDDQLSVEDQQLRDAHWKRQSLAAVTLVHLGFGDDVWSLLKFSPDPSLRSFVIHHLGKLGTDHNTLAKRLSLESEVSIRNALIQSLGGLDSAHIPSADRIRIAQQLQALYVSDPDSGIHGSAKWTARQWGITLPELPTGEPTLNEQQAQQRDVQRHGARRWYVNSQGQTMVVIPNSAEYGNSQIDHSFAISSHEVTVAEFRRFRDQYDVDSNVAPTDDCPVHSVDWYDAAEYCNWLSKREGIPEDQWVYEPNASGEYDNGMRIKENALELTGYRLPTEAEWESACRSGTSGRYGFGEPVPLLDRYAWYFVNSSGRSHSVESLLPGADGLFDMHGNLWEWLQNPSSGSMSPVRNGTSRLLRGGSFSSHTLNLGSAYRNGGPPSSRGSLLGFRPCKTFY